MNNDSNPTVDGLIFMGYQFSWFIVEDPINEFQNPGIGDFLYEL